MSKRADAIGFFWEDIAAVKPPKAEKIKRQPPERIWEQPGYLPGLEEALAFEVELLSDADLFRLEGKALIFDIECYVNYYLAAFRDPVSDKVIFFELGPGLRLDIHKLNWVLHNFQIISFNGKSYDMPITALALANKPAQFLKWATNEIILNGTRPQDILKSQKVTTIKNDHIDLIEVCPLSGSLKKYAARLHVKRMQDLPFHPDTVLTYEQAMIVRWYCINSDLQATKKIYFELAEQRMLRDSLSYEYKVDLRSKSDAQIAETVIGTEVYRLTNVRPKVPEIPAGTTYKYKVPSFIKFESDLLNWALNRIQNADYVVSEFGNVLLPEAIAGLKLHIAGNLYRMGNGGLHSSETKYSHIADHSFRLLDRDVASFYPRIILNNELFPSHLGRSFLQVYDSLVSRRLAAKKAKEKVKAESLKITINGSFGKLGSPYSILYAPDLMIQVTITGQLALLMLIERMELALIPVISANTDGIVMRVPTGMYDKYLNVVTQWEKDTNFETEETEYAALLSRDVNNYIAIKPDGETKNKGVFANPWNIARNIWQFHKNPVNLICTQAIEQYVLKHIPIERTVRECKDITKFVTVRDAKGGGVKIDEEGRSVLFMGKMLRWYYAKDEKGEIVYAKSGNKVARSEGAKPLMDLPDTFPDDVDYEWYINEAESMLVGMGYV